MTEALQDRLRSESHRVEARGCISAAENMQEAAAKLDELESPAQDAHEALRRFHTALDALSPFLDNPEVQQALDAWLVSKGYESRLSRPASVSEEQVEAAAIKLSSIFGQVWEKTPENYTSEPPMACAFCKGDFKRFARAALQAASVVGGDVAAQIEKDARILDKMAVDADLSIKGAEINDTNLAEYHQSIGWEQALIEGAAAIRSQHKNNAQ